MILDKLVLRSAPHVLRLGRYESPIEEEDVPEYVLLTVSKNLKNLMNEWVTDLHGLPQQTED